MACKIFVKSVEETNPYFDEEKQSNGGGYSQPRIEFEYRGKTGIIHDSSCGDFGARFFVEFGDKTYSYNNVNVPQPEMTTDFNEGDKDFVDAFCRTFKGKYFIYTEQELTDFYLLDD